MGPELLQRIAQALHFTFEWSEPKTGDVQIFQALKIALNEGREVEKLNQHMHAARQLGVSAKQGLSIDNIIESLEDEEIELVGKMGIAKMILEAEGKSAFSVTNKVCRTI